MIIERAPNRASSRGVTRDIAKMPRLNGRNATPAASGPKPSTRWTYCTTRKNIDRFAPITRAITASAATRRRLRTSAGWIIGCGCRASVRASSASSDRPEDEAAEGAGRGPAVLGGADQRPDEGDGADGGAGGADHVEASGAALGLGDEAAARGASTAMPIGTLMKSVQRHEPTSVSRPPRIRPIDAPPEETAPKSASARLRAASSGALVVSRARTLGAASAAPTPWRVRAATSWPGRLGEAAEGGADGEDGQADLEDLESAEDVAEPAAEQQQAAEGERVGVEHPRQRRRAEAEVGVDAGEARRSRRSRRARSSAGRPGRSRCRRRRGRRSAGSSVGRSVWARLRAGEAGKQAWVESCSGLVGRGTLVRRMTPLPETIRRLSPFSK